MLANGFTCQNIAMMMIEKLFLFALIVVNE